MKDEGTAREILLDVIGELYEPIAAYARASYREQGKGVVYLYWDIENPPDVEADGVPIGYVPAASFGDAGVEAERRLSSQAARTLLAFDPEAEMLVAVAADANSPVNKLRFFLVPLEAEPDSVDAASYVN